MILLLAFLLAQAQSAVRVCDKTDPTKCAAVINGKLEVDASVTATATTTAKATAAAPTYTEGVDSPISQDLSGNLRTLATVSTAGLATEATLSAIKTDVDKIPASPSTDRTTAGSPFSVRLSDGSGFYDGRSIRLLTASDTVSISGTVPVSGTFWQSTQPVSGTFWQSTQPVSGTFWPTTAGAPASQRLSDGAAFYDARSIRLLTSSDVVDVSDRSARLLGHVTVDNASIAVTGTFFQGTQPVSIAAAVDVSDRATRQLGKVYGSDGNPVATANTGRLQVDVITGGGGGSGATTLFNGTLVISPATGPVALPANTSKNVCIRNTKASQDAVYFGSDANFSQYNAGGYVDPGEEDCEALASSATIFVFSPGGAVIYYRGVN